MKSRPVYPGLAPDPHAQHHLVAAQGEGAAGVVDLVKRAPVDFASRLSLLYLPDSASDYLAALQALGANRFACFPARDSLLESLDHSLTASRMGTRLYVTGTEGFIGLVVRLAQQHGVKHLSIRTEHRGSLERRVYCVHCKAITESVQTNIVRCGHCQASLLVRDHYSRRLAAFMGVAVDAETPGQVPPIERLFP